MIDTTRLKFFVAMGLAGASVIVMALANKGFELTTDVLIIVGVASGGIGVGVFLVMQRKSISFNQNVREKPKEIPDEATRRLCGFKKFTAYDNLIIFESDGGRLTGHAYIHLSKLPFMIEEMTDEEQLNITRSFTRLLAQIDHPFTYMPICKPVSRVKFMKDLQHKLYNLRISLQISKVPDPRQQLEEKKLTAQWKKLSEGESPIEILYLVQIRESGKTLEEIKQKLEVDAHSMIHDLSVIHQVIARRLTGANMVDAIHDFFMLEA